MSPRRGILSLLCLLQVGCAHRVLITTEPPGARVEFARGDVATAPVDRLLWSVPFTRPHAQVSLPGYRPVDLDLSLDRRPLRRVWEFLGFHWKRALGLKPCVTHEVVLVKRHGLSGTWQAEDVE